MACRCEHAGIQGARFEEIIGKHRPQRAPIHKPRDPFVKCIEPKQKGPEKWAKSAIGSFASGYFCINLPGTLQSENTGEGVLSTSKTRPFVRRVLLNSIVQHQDYRRSSRSRFFKTISAGERGVASSQRSKS